MVKWTVLWVKMSRMTSANTLEVELDEWMGGMDGIDEWMDGMEWMGKIGEIDEWIDIKDWLE